MADAIIIKARPHLPLVDGGCQQVVPEGNITSQRGVTNIIHISVHVGAYTPPPFLQLPPFKEHFIIKVWTSQPVHTACLVQENHAWAIFKSSLILGSNIRKATDGSSPYTFTLVSTLSMLVISLRLACAGVEMGGLTGEQ